MFKVNRERELCINIQDDYFKITGKYISVRTIRRIVRDFINYSHKDILNNLLYKTMFNEVERMIKEDFIQGKLKEKGIKATDKDIKFIKIEFIENMFIYKDMEKALEEAIENWKRLTENNK